MRGISWLAAKPVSFSRRTLPHGVSKYPYLGSKHFTFCICSLFPFRKFTRKPVEITEMWLKRWTQFLAAVLPSDSLSGQYMWPLGLRLASTAAWLLGLQFLTTPGGTDVCLLHMLCVLQIEASATGWSLVQGSHYLVCIWYSLHAAWQPRRAHFKSTSRRKLEST